MTSATSTSVVVFTRDLRVRDHPALVTAAQGGVVVPLFVLDDAAIAAHGSVNRTAFLLDCLADLRGRLRERGSDLVLRRGDWVEQVRSIAAETGAAQVHLSADVSGFAQRRAGALGDALLPTGAELVLHEGINVVPPRATAPSSGGDWKVFTPYYRRWIDHPWRAALGAAEPGPLPEGLDVGALPELSALMAGTPSPGLARGGETAARERLRSWAESHLVGYEEGHNDLAGDTTSRIAAYVHFGCLSPLEVAARLRGRPGAEPFVRQLCWRDFYHQVLAGRPETSRQDYKHHGDRWRDDPDDLAAWTEGRTGFPVVDAGMRQLREEGFMHNRARMIVASFLTKDLYIDWRHGAAHFMSLLADGDVANNQLNWQWTAGTGTDSNPNRIFNPTVQSERFDPTGEDIRRDVPELADVAAPEIHEPTEATRARVGYPLAMVDHRTAIEAYRAARLP